MNEEKKYINLKNKTNVLKLYLRTEEGEETGEFLEFNLKDIELVGRYDEMMTKLQKNDEWLQNQKVIINKQQDFKNKNNFMTNNQKMLYEVTKEYLKRQTETFNMFLGDNGVQKLLNGGTFDIDSIMIIRDYIQEQILPYLNITKENITKEIKEKYKINVKEEVLE